MTGMEAWSIVAPILAAHMKMDAGMDELDQAYVLTFSALKDYDIRRSAKQN